MLVVNLSPQQCTKLIKQSKIIKEFWFLIFSPLPNFFSTDRPTNRPTNRLTFALIEATCWSLKIKVFQSTPCDVPFNNLVIRATSYAVYHSPELPKKGVKCHFMVETFTLKSQWNIYTDCIHFYTFFLFPLLCIQSTRKLLRWCK